MTKSQIQMTKGSGGSVLGATLALGQRHYNVQIYTMQPSANHKM